MALLKTKADLQIGKYIYWKITPIPEWFNYKVSKEKRQLFLDFKHSIMLVTSDTLDNV